MRVGVVGCGYWGAKHVRVLRQLPRASQVALVDSRSEPFRSLLSAFPGSPTYTDLATALPHLDAVVIATPPNTHAELALQAIAAGVHVLVEKPMTTSSRDAYMLIEAASRTGVVLMVGHTFEYNAAVWRLREAVESGELGDVHYIDTARLNLGLYQNDVNVTWDLAPHDISIMNYVLKSVPTTVQMWGSAHAHSRFEDVAYLQLRYEEVGVTAHTHISWLDPCKVRRVTIVGSEKMIVYNDLSSEEKIRIYDRGVGSAQVQDDTYAIPMSYRYGAILSPYISMDEPLSVQDGHFLDCITEQRPTLSDGLSGLAVVQVLEAAQRSMRERRPVIVGQPDDLLDAVAARSPQQ